MTTTAPRQTAAQQHHEFKHTPAGAAINTFLVTMFVATVGKLLGLPPWVALLAAGTTAGALVVAGLNRRPRPLSRGSLIFRVVAVGSAGLWTWWQLATFTNPGLSVVQAGALLIAWPVALLLLLAATGLTRVPAVVRFALPGMAILFALSLTMVMRQDVVSWLHDVLFVTDRLPWGGEHLTANGEWAGKSAVSLVVGIAPMTALGVVFANREQDADEAAAALNRAAVPRSADERAKVMLKLICDATNEYRQLPGPTPQSQRVQVAAVRIDDVRPWENGGGETYVVNLVDAKNTTVKHLRTHTDLWATKLNLPAGCGIEVLDGTTDPDHDYGRAIALLKVARKNVLRDKIPYPALMQRTIMNMLPIGVTRDGRDIGPWLRENSLFLAGQKGSGKTGTIFDLIAGLCQCTDVIVWGIDLNGGAAFAPFLRGWANGEVDRPCIDWVATTMPEVQLMTQAAVNIALDRKIFYRDLKFKFNTNLMPVGNGAPGNPPPQLAIVIDEGAEVMGTNGGEVTEADRESKAAIETIMRVARDAGVNILFCGLRATQDVASGAFKAGARARIGHRVSEANELAWLFFNNYNIKTEEIVGPGSGFICTGEDTDEIQAFKSYFLDPDGCYTIGVQTTPWRPYLDARGLEIAGRPYTGRWKRTARYLFPDSPHLDRLSSYGSVHTADDDQGAAAGTATAVFGDQPGTQSLSGVSTTYFQPPTGKNGAGNFADMMAAAEEAMRKWRGEPAPEPADEPAAPPRPVPPAGGGEHGGGAADDDNELDEAAVQARYNEAFEAVVARLKESEQTGAQLDPADPANRFPVTGDAEEAANPASREILERLVKHVGRIRGPLKRTTMLALLNQGGDWGPATPMSPQGMQRLLYKKGTTEPVEWLAPRAPREPYQHRDNVS